MDFSMMTREELEAYAAFEHGQNVEHMIKLEAATARVAELETQNAELIALLSEEEEDA